MANDDVFSLFPSSRLELAFQDEGVMRVRGAGVTDFASCSPSSRCIHSTTHAIFACIQKQFPKSYIKL
jgi:hypothetical protein